MAKFMIEVDHDSELAACARIVQVFLNSGSHYLTHAEWGCMDGVHTAWMEVEAASKEEARAIVPPGMRAQARVVGLNGFTSEQIDEILARHGSDGAAASP